MTEQTKRKRGRPSVYTPEIAEAICVRLADGEGLNAICQSEGMPVESTVRAWALDDYRGFYAIYARARELGYQRLEEEILRLADQCRIGSKTTTKANGETETVVADMVERTRLQIDARKWVLSKVLPKRYGDKVALTGDEGGPLKIEMIEMVVVQPKAK